MHPLARMRPDCKVQAHIQAPPSTKHRGRGSERSEMDKEDADNLTRARSEYLLISIEVCTVAAVRPDLECNDADIHKLLVNNLRGEDLPSEGTKFDLQSRLREFRDGEAGASWLWQSFAEMKSPKTLFCAARIVRSHQTQPTQLHAGRSAKQRGYRAHIGRCCCPKGSSWHI